MTDQATIETMKYFTAQAIERLTEQAEACRMNARQTDYKEPNHHRWNRAANMLDNARAEIERILRHL